MDICIINTGGTISCVGDPLAPMSAKDFGSACERLMDPILREMFPASTFVYEIELTFPESENGALDSTNVQPSDWCRMAQYILKIYNQYDGFVILHGTDSMDFTGAALSFLLNVCDEQGFGTAVLSKPVVMTGSQMPMFYEKNSEPLQLNFNTDAYQNFCGAVACAHLDIPEVCMYFDTRLMRGNRALKVSTDQFQAFETPNYPILAKCGLRLSQRPEHILPGPVDNAVSLDTPHVLGMAQARLRAISETIDANPVMQFNAFPAPYSPHNSTAFIANLITSCVGQGLRGLVLESYGAGNFPSGNPDTPEKGAVYRALDAANKNGVIIVNDTQVVSGAISPFTYAAGAWLSKVGALNSSDMTSVTALVKTMLLLSGRSHMGWDLDTVKTLIQLDFCGEMTNSSRLNSRTNRELLPGQSLTALDGSAILLNDPKQGVQLKSDTGNLLWSPPGLQPKSGRLVMQDDGNLVFRSENNEPLWATKTGVQTGASSVLMLCGSYEKGTLSLSVYDYFRHKTTCPLYSQQKETGHA